MLLVWGVFVASLLGSVHCAAMCGAFACMASPVRRPGQADDPGTAGAPASPWLRLEPFAYHAGRLASYLALGVAAGGLGARIDQVGDLAGWSQLAAVIAGCLMVAWAAGSIAAYLGVKVPVTLAPEWARKAIGAALSFARDRSRMQRAFLIGLATTLLPCGWLYTFVVVAAGTGSPLAGANVMFVFWIGTIPMLTAVTAGALRLFAPAMRRMPIATALIVLVLGLLSIIGKLRMPTTHAHGPMIMQTSGVRVLGR